MNIRKVVIAHVAACAVSAAAFVSPAQAAPQDITFSQLLINSCILSISTPGALANKPNGIEMNSEPGTGTSAVLAVVAVGGIPKLTFSAPQLTAPGTDSGSTAQIKYTSLSGANQGYTSAQSSYTAGALLIDAYTVDAKVNNSAGFAAGTYSVATTATCAQ